MPKFTEDNNAERFVTQAEWEQIQLNEPKTYISLNKASELSKIAKSTIRGRAQKGQYPYLRIETGHMLFYRKDFDASYMTPVNSDRAKSSSGENGDENLSIDYKVKIEKYRKLKRENDKEEGKLISVIEVQKTHRELFRLMFSDLRECIDKWSVTFNLPAEQTHKMGKDFDQTIKGVCEKLGKYNS